MSHLRLMSHNQWNYTNNNPAWEEKGLDCSAEHRMKGHVQIFKELMPDVVGGQEVNKDMQLFLKLYLLEEKLPYTIIWGNMTPLIYRADKLELLDTEYILYPVNIEGFEGKFNDSRSKACNVGAFRCKENGKVFIFATTHLWWRSGNPNWPSYQAGSDEARLLQLQQAMKLIEKYQKTYGNCPVIFGGDMNTGTSSPALQYAMGEGGYTHAHDAAVEYATEEKGYNACGPNGPATSWQKASYTTADDHILVKDCPQGMIKRFDRYCPDYYLQLSDHAPVYVDIEL